MERPHRRLHATRIKARRRAGDHFAMRTSVAVRAPIAPIDRIRLDRT
jgi:hypothetical protein